MRVWERYCKLIGKSRAIASIPISELDIILGHFFKDITKTDGQDYEPVISSIAIISKLNTCQKVGALLNSLTSDFNFDGVEAGWREQGRDFCKGFKLTMNLGPVVLQGCVKVVVVVAALSQPCQVVATTLPQCYKLTSTTLAFHMGRLSHHDSGTLRPCI